jgi:hypothetical protein
MSEPDPYWYAREHDGSGWSVRGPDGFEIKVLAGMDKNVAYVIAKLLSGKYDDADALLHDFAAMMRRLNETRSLDH